VYSLYIIFYLFQNLLYVVQQVSFSSSVFCLLTEKIKKANKNAVTFLKVLVTVWEQVHVLDIQHLVLVAEVSVNNTGNKQMQFTDSVCIISSKGMISLPAPNMPPM